MGVAVTLQTFLEGRGVRYGLVEHQRTVRSTDSAEESGVPAGCVAKGVLVRGKEGFLLAIVPASRHVALSELGAWLHQPVGLASEPEVATVFSDCAMGAVPPIPAAYGLRAVVDNRLNQSGDIFFEAGDHSTLVQLAAEDFQRLVADVPHANISMRNH